MTFSFLVSAKSPDSNEPLFCTTPMSPPNTKINTITSTASIVPLTMLDVI